MRMPGLPSIPAAEGMNIDKDGIITGLSWSLDHIKYQTDFYKVGFFVKFYKFYGNSIKYFHDL